MTFLKRIAGAAVLGTALLLGLSLAPARAYVVTLEEIGNDVVATGSGSLDLTSLTFQLLGADQSQIIAINGTIVTGPTDATSVKIYSGFTGSTTFGSGHQIAASSGSGDLVGIYGTDLGIKVPEHYSSGPLSSTATWLNQTFATLGVTPGTYAWTWGTGAPDENFVLVIGTTDAIPEPTSVALLATAFVGLLLAGTAVRHNRSEARYD